MKNTKVNSIRHQLWIGVPLLITMSFLLSSCGQAPSSNNTSGNSPNTAAANSSSTGTGTSTTSGGTSSSSPSSTTTASSTSSSTSSSSTTSSTPAVAAKFAPTAQTINANLFIGVQAFWAGTGNPSFSDNTSCVLPANAASGSVYTCTLKINEDVLHFSDITFQPGTASKTVCSQVQFIPYTYMRSLANNYPVYGYYGNTNPTTVDCSGAVFPLPTGCVGGAGSTIVPAAAAAAAAGLTPGITVTNLFPRPAIYMQPQQVQSNLFTVPSSQTYGSTLGADITILKSNLYVANYHTSVNQGPSQSFWTPATTQVGPVDPATGKATTTPVPAQFNRTAVVDFVSGTFSDYSVTCLDAQDNPLYTINLQIQSVASNPMFFSW